MTLGARIKEAAEEIGGLNKLAEMIDIARRTLGGWVDDSSEPKSGQLAKIALSTGVSVRWLVLGLGPKHEDRSLSSVLEKSMQIDKDREARGLGADLELVTVEAPPAQRILDADVVIGLANVVKRVHAAAGLGLSFEQAVRQAVDQYNLMVDGGLDLADIEEVNLRLRLYEKQLTKLVGAAMNAARKD